MVEKSMVHESMQEIERERRKIIQPYFTGLGLTLGQGQPRILARLLEKEEVTQKELSELCRLDVTTLSRALDRLEETGLIARKAQPSCRRSNCIVLTEEGRSRAREVKKVIDALQSQMWQGFSQQELECFYNTLCKVLENLKQIHSLK